MREIVFLVTEELPGRIVATALERGLLVEAPTLEELHHEARDALIRQVGPSHATYRIRIRRADHQAAAASDQPPDQQQPRPRKRAALAETPAGEGRGAPGHSVVPPAPAEPVGAFTMAARLQSHPIGPCRGTSPATRLPHLNQDSALL